VSVAVSWWVVRRDAPWLMIWAVFGVAAGTLPGQVFIINDSIWQQTLFWPLFLSVFVRLTKPQIVVLSILGIFQFVHQIGVPLLAGAAMAAGIVAYIDRENRPWLRRRATVMGSLAMIAIAKIIITNHIPALEDTYAEQEFAWWRVRQCFEMGVEGWPLAGLMWMWFASLFVLLQSRLRDAFLRRFLGVCAVLFVAVAGGIWVYWASDGQRWWKALDYRRWILPLTLPFFAFAFLDVCLAAATRRGSLDEDSRSPGTVRGAVAFLLACVFAAVLGMQATVWSRLLHRVVAEVDRSPQPAIALESMNWIRQTPLDHWGTCDAVTFLEGKVPRKLLVTELLLPKLRARRPTVPNQGWFLQPALRPPPPGPGGWFDFRPVISQLKATPRPSSRPKE
jgi:hypothetical protein